MRENYLTLRIGLILFFILISFTNCKQANKKTSIQELSKTSIENFDEFYDKFHKDSLFQISRLKFPLKGGPDGDNNEKWTKKNWSMLKTKIYDVDKSQYKVSYKRDKKSFTEKIWIEDSGFEFECKFELIGNQWFLTSAFELNN